MAEKSSLEQALRRFTGAGIKPTLCALHALGSKPVTSLFDDDLRTVNAAPLPALSNTWTQLSIQQANVALAVRRHRAQAYGDTRGQPANHLRAAKALLEELEAQRAWANSTTVEVADALTLQFPENGYAVGVGIATFEELVLVEGRTHALLALWTDED